MTQPFGNPGRKPGRGGGPPPGSPSRGGFRQPQPGYQRPDRRDPQPFQEDDPDEMPVSISRPDPVTKPVASTSRRNAGIQPVVTAERIEPGRRIVALVFDVLACYLVAVVIASLPFVRDFIDLQIAWVSMLLCRDFFFQGRGVGKNLMGLQVVDVTTGRPCNLMQSVLRNIIILGPAVVVLGISVILRFLPLGWLSHLVSPIVNIAGMIYVAVVLPIEAHRAYSRDDSMRKGDELAGTAIIDAPMDFSTVLPK